MLTTLLFMFVNVTIQEVFVYTWNKKISVIGRDSSKLFNSIKNSFYLKDSRKEAIF